MTDEGETGYCYCSCTMALRGVRGCHARPAPPSIPIGPGLTEDKPQSKLWYTDNADRTVTWWGILGFVGDANAAPGVYFYNRRMASWSGKLSQAPIWWMWILMRGLTCCGTITTSTSLC